MMGCIIPIRLFRLQDDGRFYRAALQQLSPEQPREAGAKGGRYTTRACRDRSRVAANAGELLRAGRDRPRVAANGGELPRAGEKKREEQRPAESC